MKECFVDKGFRAETLDLIEQINDILDDYNSQGFVLSLRQLYYQLVSRDLIPNTIQDYKRIGNIVGDGRLAGLIDWEMIEDREREVVYPAHWADAPDIIMQAARQFRVDRWENQPRHVEVMVEKKALEGVLIPVCRDVDVRLTANRGYSSLSAMYEAGKRIQRAYDDQKDVYILYLGDHDPSGLDMDRDILGRLGLFSGVDLEVERLALLYSQIEQMRPPENPAKLTDSRAPGYIARFGMSSWELDAIEPRTLAQLVRDAVIYLRDDDLWQETIAREEVERAKLMKAAQEMRNGS
jgi:hypothetical protein